jgi:hypothetical protein
MKVDKCHRALTEVGILISLEAGDSSVLGGHYSGARHHLFTRRRMAVLVFGEAGRP